MNPMVDGWMGDDWFHNGAFRQQNIPYIYEQEATRSNDVKWWSNYHDDYDLYMHYVSAGALGKAYGVDQVGFWRKLVAHPAYDSFWQEQAMDKILARQPLKVPVMLVHSLWDQEDIYGAMAVYRAIEPKDKNNDMVYLVVGPWHHGQEIEEASSLGAIKFGSDTGRYFREHILRPFLAHYLKDGAPKDDVAPVTAFVTGADQWERLDQWPAGCASGCSVTDKPLYLEPNHMLGFGAPRGDGPGYDEYVSDPAKPVPFRARPIQPVGYVAPQTWSQWLVDDQREMSGRTDVLTYESAVLTRPVKISGRPQVHLVASTSGTDSDWVVKLIDVYPDQVAEQPELGGYQLMVSADILRGRYRRGFDKAEPIKADTPLPYRWYLPTANHVFLPGHRIMVQIQSSWFPLYDRNPQTFVPNIFFAKPADYMKATQKIYRTPRNESYIELPLASSPNGG
jgi:putative CocE/NonD family hydrolase